MSKVNRELDEFLATSVQRILHKPADEVSDGELEILKAAGVDVTREQIEQYFADECPPAPRWMTSSRPPTEQLTRQLVRRRDNSDFNDDADSFKATLQARFTLWKKALTEISDSGFWKGMQADLDVIGGRIAARLQEQQSGVIANDEDDDDLNDEVPRPVQWMLSTSRRD